MNEISINSETLSNDQKLFLANLNYQLSQIERNIIIEFCKLNARVADPKDYVKDYDIDFDLTFYLDKNDPKYNINSDNVLIKILDRSLYPNVNEKPKEKIYSGYPMIEREQGRFYHILYSNTDFGLSKMLRIGYIEVEVNIKFHKSTINLTEKNDFLKQNVIN